MLSTIPAARKSTFNATSILHGKNLVVFGGGSRNSNCQNLEIQLYDTLAQRWVEQFDVETEVCMSIGHTVCCLGTSMYLFGGEADGRQSRLLKYEYENNIVSCKPMITTMEGPCARAWHAACTISWKDADAMLICGGIDESGNVLNDVWIFSMEKVEEDDTTVIVPTWRQLEFVGDSPLPLSYHSCSATKEGSLVLVIGGHNGEEMAPNVVHTLDIPTATWTSIELQSSILKPIAFHKVAECKICMNKETNNIEQPIQCSEEEMKDRYTISLQHIISGGYFEDGTPQSKNLLCLNLETRNVTTIPASTFESVMGLNIVTDASGQCTIFLGGIDATGQETNVNHTIQFLEPLSIEVVAPVVIEEEQPEISPREKTITSSNGDSYFGEIVDGVRSGQGKCTYIDGNVYQGDWLNDCREGHGVMDYIQKGGTRQRLKYVGNWKDDNFHGQGCCTYSDGSKITGNWIHGKCPSTGTIENYTDCMGRAPREKMTYTGAIEDENAHGQGESKSSELPKAGDRYVGEFSNGFRHGRGICNYFDGTVYEGEWRSGRKNGYGKCKYATTRNVYDGKWIGGVRCGQGICYFASGNIYNGEWKNNQENGSGIFTDKDGNSTHGIWSDGNLVAESVNDQVP